MAKGMKCEVAGCGFTTDLFDYPKMQTHLLGHLWQSIEALDDRLFSIEHRLMPERRCRKCGCTNERACEGGCCWIEDTLCSSCAAKEMGDGE